MSSARSFDPSPVETLSRELGPLGQVERLARLLELYGDELRFESSFGLEDSVLVHLAAQAGKMVGKEPFVFLLDTGRLHPETYELVEHFRNTYRIAIRIYAPDAEALQSLVSRRGPNAFYKSVEDRHACCDVRKAEPLTRALSGARAWVSGLRREQNESGEDVSLVASDPARPGVLKVAPLFDWTFGDLRGFAKSEGVPVHPLVERGYASIGCAPCTRALSPGEHPRNGRFPWEAGERRESGVHKRGKKV
jgi:phosphoadenosine phosphosulfate reductase